ncbi:UBA domain-containing protein mud1 [Porphyridium purpureum]|uniref:UBA domain-containing protein mud1 n=1 Tax=Porphyridium purpureum TaxID=35688 RepID=A0A5J4Z8G6_PORPP|nr:UBA domain-containing protein mud1 [Porphyridium purpureum]|eukprot:POR3113..scf295_1
MKLVLSDERGEVSVVDVDEDASVENVKLLIEGELGIPAAMQMLLLNGVEIAGHGVQTTLKAAGVAENDLLLVRRCAAAASSSAAAATPAASGSAAATAGRNANSPSSWAAALSSALSSFNANKGSARQQQGQPPASVSEQEARQLVREVRDNPGAMQRLGLQFPRLVEAIRNSDEAAVAREMVPFKQAMVQVETQRMNAHQAKMARIAADPMSVEAQEYMAETIRQQNVETNLAAAYEHNPEAFAKVVMLFIHGTVNGVDVTMFVDSGAQSTIISKACAERCNILHLLDTRFQGIARGVGTARILGRVHMAEMRIEKQHLLCSFTVMEDFNYDILFGLDMLRKHRASIDLERDCLRIQGVEARFLPEKDIPRLFRDPEYINDSSLASPPTSAASAAGAAAVSRSMGWAANSSNARRSSDPVAPSLPGSVAVPNGSVSAASIPDLEAKVTRLVAIGFDSAQARTALIQFGGSEELAASFLLEHSLTQKRAL